MGVITNVTALIQPQLLQANATLNNNCDVYLTISKIVKQCALMQPQLLNVEGHQDKEPNCPLTMVEAYNVDCNN